VYYYEVYYYRLPTGTPKIPIADMLAAIAPLVPDGLDGFEMDVDDMALMGGVGIGMGQEVS